MCFVSSCWDESVGTLPGPQRVGFELRRSLLSLDLELDCYDPRRQFLRLMIFLYVNRKRLSAVHFSEHFTPSAAAAIVTRLLGIRSSFTVHSVQEHRQRYRSARIPWRRWVSERLVRKAVNVLVALSRRERELLGPTLRKKVQVIPNGTRCIEGLTGILRRHALHPGGLTIIAVGGSRSEKNLIGLISAMESLNVPEKRLIVFGRPGDDQAAAESYSGPVELELRGEVGQKELWRICKTEADLFAQVGCYEPFGMAALDAIALGIPVVLSEECGLAEHLNTLAAEYTDWIAIAPCSDTEHIARAINTIYRGCLNPGSCPEIDPKVLLAFSWESVARQYIDLWTGSCRA